MLYLCHHLENGNHFDVHGFAAHIRAGDNEKVIIGCCYLEIDADGYNNQNASDMKLSRCSISQA